MNTNSPRPLERFAAHVPRIPLLFLSLAAAALQAQEMVTRSFDVPTKFPRLVGEVFPKPQTDESKPDDPFSPYRPPALEPQEFSKSSLQILKDAGLPFPEGSAAFHDATHHVLTVRNTPANMKIVEQVIATLNEELPVTLSIRADLVEAPGSELRRIAALDFEKAAPALAALLKQAFVPGSNVRVVRTALVESQSGMRSDILSGFEDWEHSGIEAGENGHVIQIDKTARGFHFETDAYGSNSALHGRGIDLNFAVSHHPLLNQINEVEPQVRMPFQHGRDSISTSIQPRDELPCLAGLWDAPGPNQDLLQAVVITVKTIVHKPLRTKWDNVFRPNLEEPVAKSFQHVFDLPKDAWTLPARFGLGENKDIADDLRQAGIQLPEDTRVSLETPHRLSVQADLETMEIIQRWLVEQHRGQATSLDMTLEIVRGPASLLRPMLEDIGDSGDDTPLWSQAHEAVRRGEARIISTLHARVDSKHEVQLTAGNGERRLNEVGWTRGRDQHAWLATEEGFTGVKLKLLPTLGEDGQTMAAECKLEWNPAPAIPGRMVIPEASAGGIELPHVRERRVELSSHMVLMDGTTKLIGAWNPESGEVGDAGSILELAFMKVHFARHPGAAHEDPTMRPLPPGVEPPPPPKPGMETRVFRVWPDFLSLGSPPKEGDPSLSASSAKKILSDQGIPFPEGSEAYYTLGSRFLIVTNTRESLDFVEMFAGGGCGFPPRNPSMRLHLFEGASGLIRDVLARGSGQADHRPILEEMNAAVTRGDVKRLGTQALVTRAGQKATVKKTREHERVVALTVSPQGLVSVERETLATGMEMEVDPTIDADGETLDLGALIEHHPAPPSRHNAGVTLPGYENEITLPLMNVWRDAIVSRVTMKNGTACIFAVWPPSGKPGDTLHMAILEASLQDGEE